MKIKYTGPFVSVRLSHPVIQESPTFLRDEIRDVSEESAEKLLKTELFAVVQEPPAPQLEDEDNG